MFNSGCNKLINLNETYCSKYSFNKNNDIPKNYKLRRKDKDEQAFHNSKECHKVIFKDLGLCKVCLSKNKSYLCCTSHNKVKGKQEAWIKDKLPVFFI